MDEPRTLRITSFDAAKVDDETVVVMHDEAGQINVHFDVAILQQLIGALLGGAPNLNIEQTGVRISRFDDGDYALSFKIAAQSWLSAVLSPTELLMLRDEIVRVTRRPNRPPVGRA